MRYNMEKFAKEVKLNTLEETVDFNIHRNSEGGSEESESDFSIYHPRSI